MKIQDCSVGFIDYGCGNIYNLRKIFHGLGVKNAERVGENESNRDYDLLVMPGVGHFEYAIESMTQNGQRNLLLDHMDKGKKLLAICLGMQLLMRSSEEAPGVDGLNVFDGAVTALKNFNTKPGALVPNVGYRQVEVSGGSRLIQEGDEFYFDHSFAPVVTRNGEIQGTTDFEGEAFTSYVEKENIVGVQFHPELSGKTGFRFLNDFLRN